MPSYTCHDAQSSTRFVPAYNELLRCFRLRNQLTGTAYKARTATVSQGDLNAMRSALFTMGRTMYVDMAAVEAALATSSDQPATLFTDNLLWKDITSSTPLFLLLPGRCTSTGQDVLASQSDLDSAYSGIPVLEEHIRDIADKLDTMRHFIPTMPMDAGCTIQKLDYHLRDTSGLVQDWDYNPPQTSTSATYASYNLYGNNMPSMWTYSTVRLQPWFSASFPDIPHRLFWRETESVNATPTNGTPFTTSSSAWDSSNDGTKTFFHIPSAPQVQGYSMYFISWSVASATLVFDCTGASFL